MKFRHLSVIIVTLLFCTLFANSQTISYTYDNAGNRTSRTIVLSAQKAKELQRPDSELTSKQF